MDDESESTYLGDGVYASYDGYSVWLAVNHHENNVVALEPPVLSHLVQYIETLKEKKAVDAPDVVYTQGWNEALDEAAARISNIRGFGQTTQDSFSVFIKGLKK